MKTLDLYQLLHETSYPGRGIVLGLAPDGRHAAIAYFIMGRSANSRNRVFAETDDGIETRAADPAKLEDPSLIIYRPVRTLGDDFIVTNGDQTDTVYTALTNGGTFEAALRTRGFEPDAPNWTPRISGILNVSGGAASYKLSILKSGDVRGTSCRRFFYEYPHPLPGEGHFIHTYRQYDVFSNIADSFGHRFGDDQVREEGLPSFEGEPWQVEIPDSAEEFATNVWNALNWDNKVSLFVRYVDLETQETEDVILNKYDEVL